MKFMPLNRRNVGLGFAFLSSFGLTVVLSSPSMAVFLESIRVEARSSNLVDVVAQGAQSAQSDVLETLLELVNAERQKVGAPPLVLSAQLTEAAQAHALDMATNSFLSHSGSNGSTMQTRIEATGYDWSAIGENVAMGQPTPEAVMASWMNSSGHRQNILNPNFSELGLGYAEATGGPYWVQVFGQSR